jgi:hypothetical protein
MKIYSDFLKIWKPTSENHLWRTEGCKIYETRKDWKPLELFFQKLIHMICALRSQCMGLGAIWPPKTDCSARLGAIWPPKTDCSAGLFSCFVLFYSVFKKILAITQLRNNVQIKCRIVAKYYPKLKVVLKNDEIFSQKHFFLKLLASF